MRVSDWFFEQGPDTPKEEYNNMFKELKSHTIDYFIRLRESKELPGGNDIINYVKFYFIRCITSLIRTPTCIPPAI